MNIIRSKNVEDFKILPKRKNLDWAYDEEADVLCISIKKPQKALGIDAGEGMIIRCREDTKEVVGLTITGFKDRFLKAMGS